MRRSTVRLAGLLVAVSLASVAPALVVAQEDGLPEPGERIVYERIDRGDPTDEFGDKLELYRFTFEVHEAHLPEPDPDAFPDISAEAMMVFVESGLLVIYTPPEMEEGAVVVVTADGGPVNIEQYLDATTPAPEGIVECPSPCTVPSDTYALVEPGDYVFHAANAGCPYCNENQGPSVLQVAPLTATDGDFSWKRISNEQQAAPASEEEATPAARRMAYRLNPNPPCAGKYS